MRWTIRAATPADAATLVENNRLMALETEGKTLDLAELRPGVAAVLADARKGYYYVALDEHGDIVGQAMFTFEWSDWRNGWFWWLQSVFVSERARRQGVFAALFEHVLGMARRDPEVVGLRLYVEHENVRAQETYRRCGMSSTGYLVFEIASRG